MIIIISDSRCIFIKKFIKRLFQRKINFSLIFENLIGERCSTARNRRSDVISQYTEVQYRNIQNSKKNRLIKKYQKIKYFQWKWPIIITIIFILVILYDLVSWIFLCRISFKCWVSSREPRNQKKKNPEPGRNHKNDKLGLFWTRRSVDPLFPVETLI